MSIPEEMWLCKTPLQDPLTMSTEPEQKGPPVDGGGLEEAVNGILLTGEVDPGFDQPVQVLSQEDQEKDQPEDHPQGVPVLFPVEAVLR